MIVVSLEGAQGVGKTTLLDHVAKVGYSVENELFIDVQASPLDPQSFLNESCWVSAWFQRVLQSKASILVTDRSPFSAVCFSKTNNSLLDNMVKANIAEMEEIGVHVKTVHVKVEEPKLWDRICARLEKNPHREKYNEGSRPWLKQVLQFYESHEWDYEIDNTGDTAVAQLTALLNSLSSKE